MITAQVLCPIYDTTPSYTYTMYYTSAKSIVLHCMGIYTTKVMCYDPSGVELDSDRVMVEYGDDVTYITILANAFIIHTKGGKLFNTIPNYDEKDEWKCFEKEDQLCAIEDHREKLLESTTPSQELFKTMRRHVVHLINKLLIEYDYKLLNVIERFTTNMIPSEFLTDFIGEFSMIRVYLQIFIGRSKTYEFSQLELSMSKTLTPEMTEWLKSEWLGSGNGGRLISYWFS
jgi:hypothetical protein